MHMKQLTKEEFKKVSKIFLARLDDEMSAAGCNDLCEDEFPKSIREKFGTDDEVFRVWKSMIKKMMISSGDDK